MAALPRLVPCQMVLKLLRDSSGFPGSLPRGRLEGRFLEGGSLIGIVALEGLSLIGIVALEGLSLIGIVALEGLSLMGEEVWEGPGMGVSSTRYTASSIPKCSSSTSSRGEVGALSTTDGVGSHISRRQPSSLLHICG